LEELEKFGKGETWNFMVMTAVDLHLFTVDKF